MGAVPYWYVVKYQPDVNAALQELREREFRAGRYNPVMPFPFHTASLAPGPRRRTIREALQAAGADGTRSILDLGSVSEEPELGTVAPLPDEVLLQLFGTMRPTREMVEQGTDSEYLERGQGIYLIIYRDDQPDEILFAGCSYD